MFRNYPLSCLFILATICVDLALLFTANPHSAMVGEGATFYIYNFALPAQLNTLAIWAVMGKTHRLTKAAWVTFAFGSLLLLTWAVEGWFSRESNTLNFIQFFVVLGGVSFWRAWGLGQLADVESREPIRFSLVEMFGWTIIVAFWAFALRFAGLGDVIVDAYLWVWVITLAVTPILLVPVLFSKISIAWRCGGLIAVFVIVFIAYSIADRFVGDNPIALWALSMAITQIIFITAWRVILAMDKSMRERRAVAQASREKLALYDPNES